MLPLTYLKEVFADNVLSEEDALVILEITMEDILDRFEDRLYSCSHKYIVGVEDEQDEDDDETWSWESRGFRTFRPEGEEDADISDE